MNPDPPVVSVVMPVYNGATLVRRAIDSVFTQTFPSWELLIADDGSADDTPRVLAAAAAADPRVRTVRLPVNAGPSAARNAALRLARGGTVAYLDHDDEFYPDYLGRVAEWRAKGDVLVFGYDLVEERPGRADFGTARAYDPRPHLARLPYENIVVPLGVAHRRDLLGRSGSFDERLGFDEDTDLWRRFALAGASFTFVPHRSGRYHVRPDSRARTRPPSPGGAAPGVVRAEVRVGDARYALRIPAADAWVVRSVFEGGEYAGVPAQALRSPPVVLDVGGNAGTFALYAKLCYHPAAVVHAFEPYPPSAALFRENLAGFTEIVLHPFALSDRDGEAELYLHPTSPGNHSLVSGLAGPAAGRVTVPLRDAGRVWDELGLTEVDVLKVDAEGSEVPVLQSLGARLGAVRAVLAEYHSRRDRRRIDALLSGFDLFGAVVYGPDRGVVKYLRADLARPVVTPG